MKTVIPLSPSSLVPGGRRGRTGLAALFLTALASLASAQPDCRSVLGAHLKPLTRESPLSWAGELVSIPAYLEDRYANNTMFFGGLDFTTRSKAHQFYFEGGIKRSTVDSTKDAATTTEHIVSVATPVGGTGVPVGTGTAAGSGKGKPATAGTGEATGSTSGTAGGGTTETAAASESGGATTKYTSGWRELFYQYNGENSRLRAGLSTTRLGDYFLVNERMLGLSFVQRVAQATVHATVGSVGEFARMTEFCGTKRLTNLVDKEKYETVSEDFGDTNLAGVVATWDLRRPAPPAKAAAPDEFTLTEDLAPRQGRGSLALRQVGVVLYHELDTRTDIAKSWVGGLLQADLPFAWNLRTEALYQNGVGANAIVYLARADKELFWSNASNTTLHAGYYGRHDLGGPARFEAAFTNLFQGEIMRLDAIDVPLLFAGVRHNFPGKRKLYAQLQGVRQIKDEKVREWDLEVGADFFRRLRVVAIGSYIESTATRERENFVGKMEVRLGF
jgi:hypothetical protein